jgi:hypothetical protein
VSTFDHLRELLLSDFPLLVVVRSSYSFHLSLFTKRKLINWFETRWRKASSGEKSFDFHRFEERCMGGIPIYIFYIAFAALATPSLDGESCGGEV